MNQAKFIRIALREYKKARKEIYSANALKNMTLLYAFVMTNLIMAGLAGWFSHLMFCQ